MSTVPPRDLPGHAATSGQGLVICATTGRVRAEASNPQRVTAFPTPELVGAAAALFDSRPTWAGGEGPRPLLTIGPGVLALNWPDVARRERTAERAEEGRRRLIDQVAAHLADGGEMPEDPEPSRVVSGWSAKSRSRMVRVLAELDYGPLLGLGCRLPMTTLTYPGDWLTVAASGKEVKRHMAAFWRRWLRAWGFQWVGIWKLEFQRRGAPHLHLWGPEPAGLAGELAAVTKVRRRSALGDGLPYRRWLSVVWADVVAHPDPDERRRHELAGTAVDFVEGGRMTDPKRLAVYFTKHGGYAAKEYQNCVPDQWTGPGMGPGRFWGYKGLERGSVEVELHPSDAVRAARVLRAYSAAQGVTRRVSVVRRSLDLATGEVRERRRSVRRPVRRIPGLAGFICVNDGPALASMLARALVVQGVPDSRRRQAELAARRAELASTERSRASESATSLLPAITATGAGLNDPVKAARSASRSDAVGGLDRCNLGHHLGIGAW
jgi:hypothetical protein